MAVLFLPVFLVIGFASRNKVLEEHAVIDDLYMEDKERRGKHLILLKMVGNGKYGIMNLVENGISSLNIWWKI